MRASSCRSFVLSLALLLPLLAAPRVFAEHTPEEVKKQRNLIELGLYLGVYLPPSDHELYDPTLTHRELNSVNFDVGLRAGYFPFAYVGVELEGGVMLSGTEDGSALVYTARAHVVGQYPVWQRLCPFVVLGGGMLGVSSDETDAVGSDLDGMLYWGVGAKYYLLDYLAVRLDVRHDLTVGRGDGLSHHFEVLAGVSFVIGWTGDKDSDKDGIADSQDKCPTKYAKTKDGCPPADTDGDGVLDKNDKCPKQPASTADGCPDADPDKDGIIGDADKCPQKPETKNGYQDEDGCPDELPDAVKNFTGAIKGITFRSGKAKIRRSSYKTLDKAVALLKKYEKLALIIRGHTDDRGKEASNIKLSQRRARAVKAYLVKKGIDASRLSTEGLGPAEPIASNKTRKGRAANRRIEFKLKK